MSYKRNETPTGDIDGANKTYVTASNIYQVLYIIVDHLVYEGEVIINGNSFTLADAPITSVTITYLVSPYTNIVATSTSGKPQKVISNDEFTLITGHTDDANRMNFWQGIALKLLCDALGVKDLGRHSVVAERCKITNCEFLRTRAYPVDYLNMKMYLYVDQVSEILGYTFKEDFYDKTKFWALNADGLTTSIPYDEVFLDYTAGFVLKGELTLLSNDLEDEILTIDALGTETAYTFIADGEPEDDEILIGEDEEATAENIATALGGTVVEDGEGSFVVIMPFGYSATFADEEKMLVANPDLPDDLKACVAYIMAGGLIDTAGSEEVSSYTIGSKTVNFRSNAEKNFVKSTLDKYGMAYNKPLILS